MRTALLLRDTFPLGGLTNNIGNRFVVARLLTTRWPLAAFLAYLSTQLEQKNILFEIDVGAT